MCPKAKCPKSRTTVNESVKRSRTESTDTMGPYDVEMRACLEIGAYLAVCLSAHERSE